MDFFVKKIFRGINTPVKGVFSKEVWSRGGIRRVGKKPD
jgi:hypothetical protein